LLEIAGKQKDAERVRQGIEQLADFLERVEVTYG
jgi:hypothetical protein